MTKSDKGNGFADLRRFERFGCCDLGRALVVVGAKGVEGIVGSVVDKGFKAGMETATARGPLAKHQRAV